MNEATMAWVLWIVGTGVGMFGWMLYWAGLPVIGGVVGAGAGGAVGFIASGALEASWGLPVLTGLGLAVGLFAGALLTRLFQHYIFFAAGAALLAALVWQLVTTPTFRDLFQNNLLIVQTIATILAALIGGLVLLKLQRFIVAVVTAVIGAGLFGAGFSPELRFVLTIVALVVFLSIQVGLVSRYVSQEKFEQRMRRLPKRPQE